ncbi:MAG: outer membrane lipid asymmetry maintenance protein MlaD [Coxiella sp. (in: Bacteria)]|nr:MAG: outer membrane lipid asymmetry maintenance protein MlaD [Coxiella sp. (in: g-proteobacteria)]
MRHNHTIETIVGFFLLISFLALLVLAFWVSGLTGIGNGGSYTLYADFDNIGGLKVRAPVAIAGVKVGSVTHIVLDPKTFRARVTIHIEKSIQDLPFDTSASVLTQGLLGANYISILPGLEEGEELKANETIGTTHSALILENVIGQLIYNLKNDDKDKKQNDKI